MKMEDITIEDTTDANYFIKKFFNNDYKKITMPQLEQLVLTVYNMGKKNAGAADSAPVATEPKSAPPPPPKTNTFKVNDRVKTIGDIEIGHSGEFMTPDKIGIITLIKGDIITALYEMGEDGEMLEINFPFDKLEKVS